jgi:hypothetical protein
MENGDKVYIRDQDMANVTEGGKALTHEVRGSSQVVQGSSRKDSALKDPHRRARVFVNLFLIEVDKGDVLFSRARSSARLRWLRVVKIVAGLTGYPRLDFGLRAERHLGVLSLPTNDAA